MKKFDSPLINHTKKNIEMPRFREVRICQLVVSTHLKNGRQNGKLPQIGVKIKNI